MVVASARDGGARGVDGEARGAGERSEFRKVSCALSGRDGAYRIEGLLGVRHVVTAGAPGFIPRPYFTGEGASRREGIDLKAGQELRGVDFTLQGGGVEIHGVVKDLSGGAVEGAQVSGANNYALTGADGLFSMWVKPGSAWVSAQADGYATGHDSGVAPGHHYEVFLTPEAVLIGKVVRAADGTPVEGAEVTAASGGWNWSEAMALSDADGNFRLDGLEPGVYKARAESDELMGRAKEQTILGLGETSAPVLVEAHPSLFVEGKIVTDAGKACDDGSLYLKDHANSRDAWTQVEADGVVRARGLLPGEFQVNIHCKGQIPAERYDRVILADKSLSGLRWEVAGGRAIRGLVVDAGGKAVEGVSVSANAKPDPSKPRAQQTNAWSGRTDGDGRFELGGLLAGEYEVTVSAWNPPRATPDKPIPVRVTADRDVEDMKIVLPASGELKGTVRDAQGRPVGKDVEVALRDGKRWNNIGVADDGSFRFESLAPGEYRVTANRKWEPMRAPGTTDDDLQGEKVTIREGQVETVQLVVAGAAEKIVGVVRDEDGGPVADAFIEATLESDSATVASGNAARDGRWGSFWGTPNLSDPDGRFTLTDLTPGKHTLRAHRKGGGEAILEHVESGSDVVLTIAATGRMSGTVALRGGGVPEDFSINIEDEKTGFRRFDQFFRTNGAWSLAELPAGHFKVRVAAGAGAAEVEATMTAGQDTTGLRIELTPKVTVRGTVVDLEGKPAPGLHVGIDGGGAWGDGDEKKLNITDDAGRFEVTRAPTGKVTVFVYPSNWGSGDYESMGMPAVIAAGESTVELPPIRIGKKRVKEGDVTGDLGFGVKQPEPGADPMLARIVVATVRPGGPAAAAGLVPGDEVVSVDGQACTGPNAYLFHQLTRVVPDTVVDLGLARGASVKLTVGAPP